MPHVKATTAIVQSAFKFIHRFAHVSAPFAVAGTCGGADAGAGKTEASPSSAAAGWLVFVWRKLMKRCIT